MSESCEEDINLNETEDYSLLTLNYRRYYVNTLSEFLEVLQDYEITTRSKFVLLSSYKKFSQGSVELKSKMMLHWEDDVPYFHFGSRVYGCHMGKDVNRCQKEKYKQRRDAQATKNPSLMRYRPKKTKKLGCPASIRVVRMVRLTDFKVSGCVSTKPLEKAKITRIIKRKIDNLEPVGEECFMFNLPDVTEHRNHEMGPDVVLTDPIDQRVKEKIFSLVQNGHYNAVAISKLLNTYVENELKVTDRLRRGYYPDLTVIRKFVYKCKAKASLLEHETDNKNSNVIVKKLQYPETNTYSSLNIVENDSSISDNYADDSDDSTQKSFRDEQNESLSESVEEWSESLSENCEGGETSESSMRESNKEVLIKSCDSSIRLIQTIMKYINEEKLEQLSTKLDDLVSMFANKVTTIKCIRCPVESNSPLGIRNYGKLVIQYNEGSSQLEVPNDIINEKDSEVGNSYNEERLPINSTMSIERRNDGKTVLPFEELPNKTIKASENVVAPKIVSIKKESTVNDSSNLVRPKTIESSPRVLVASALPAETQSGGNHMLQFKEEPMEIIDDTANGLSASSDILFSNVDAKLDCNSLKRQHESQIVVIKRRKDNSQSDSHLQASLPDHSYHTHGVS